MKQGFAFIQSLEEFGRKKGNSLLFRQRVSIINDSIQNEKGNMDGFINTLRTILYRFKGKIIDIWVDNARWHKGKKIDDFLNDHTEIIINYIPKYHPELNKQETLWRIMRYEETTNTYYESFEDLEFAVLRCSQIWKPKKILSLCHLN